MPTPGHHALVPRPRDRSLPSQLGVLEPSLACLQEKQPQPRRSEDSSLAPLGQDEGSVTWSAPKLLRITTEVRLLVSLCFERDFEGQMDSPRQPGWFATDAAEYNHVSQTRAVLVVDDGIDPGVFKLDSGRAGDDNIQLFQAGHNCFDSYTSLALIGLFKAPFQKRPNHI